MDDYELMENYTRKLFERGTQMAAKMGLILADTKYEFGKANGKIYLIDEIHTPDSSRYFYADSYEEKFVTGKTSQATFKRICKDMAYGKRFPG
jgi:phosphoribosylaminoimidazole-succinocarboxamide synthase